VGTCYTGKNIQDPKQTLRTAPEERSVRESCYRTTEGGKNLQQGSRASFKKKLADKVSRVQAAIRSGKREGTCGGKVPVAVIPSKGLK